MKRPRSSKGSKKTVEKESLLEPSMEQQDEAEVDEVDEEDDMAGGHEAQSFSSCGLGEKKRRLALDQVRALERNFDTDNKLDPDRKDRIARDLGLQPRQVAVWFQNRRARWKTKQLERDFAALLARHDALRADCDGLRRDKDALAAEIRELREKLSKPDTAVSVKAEAGNDGAEVHQAAGGAAAATIYKDGSSDSDSSVVFNDEVSPYSAEAFDPRQPGFIEFSSFLDASAATVGSPSLPALESKWNGSYYPYESYKGGIYGFTEELLASSGVMCNDSASFFSEEHASNLNFGWCASGTEGWE
ncbi:hypothetical protein GUJ93_ZPchr0006g44983 [Zizania palustris]|uniref:Homeobox-leucine zipper protein n=1 Tax=Zizania palustris TaxID=103762 RepID=A0A8J5T430_ZIZPA|nr:hypothetical protein GUJ93_ZPchr0006g44983 [Zizania palustris]